MSIALTTAGVKLGYAVETTAGQKPTTSFLNLKGVKTIPSTNIEPATHQSTDLNQTTHHTYVPGLMDIGGALTFTFNYTQEFSEMWADLREAFETARAANREVWFQVDIPNIDNGHFFTGEPSPLGMPEMGVDEVLEIETFITPSYIYGEMEKVAIVDTITSGG